MLDDLGVDAIELPKLDSPEAVAELTKKFRQAGVKTQIAYFSAKLRGNWKRQIDQALQVEADILDLHFSFSPREIFSDFEEGISKAEILKIIEGAVPYARSRVKEVAFGWSKTTRSPLETIKSLYGAAAEAGAKHLHVYDSRGSVFPSAARYLVQELKKKVGETHISIHCHNDFGLATANSLAAVEGGATWCEVSVNGLGDRAGNSSLEEMAAALEILYGVRTGIRMEKLYGIAKFTEKITGIQCQRHKAIVGENAFLEESASHMLQVKEAEESNLPEANVPFMAAVVGQTQRYVYGSTTLWGDVLETKIAAMGFHPSGEELRKVREILEQEIRERRFLTEAEVAKMLSKSLGKSNLGR